MTILTSLASLLLRLLQAKKKRGRPPNSSKTHTGELSSEAHELNESNDASSIKKVRSGGACSGKTRVMSEQEQKDRDDCLQLAEVEYHRQAFVIDDINDLIFYFLSKLPMCCWLELDADYPRGRFYHEGLSVNKLLNINAQNLKELLAAHASVLGKSGPLKNIIFVHGAFAKLSRADGTRARWIFLRFNWRWTHTRAR